MQTWLSILVIVLFTFLVRALPIALLKDKIDNEFFQSFLYYVPYVTLAVMTVPAIFHSTQSPWAGVAAFVVGVLLALREISLFTIACLCSATVFVLEYFLC